MLPRLWTRNGTHYFRAKVPRDLLAHFAPKRELKWSLRTKDLRRAKTLVYQASVRVDAQFDKLRREGASSNPPPSTELRIVDEIDDKFIEAVCATWLREGLETDIAFRTNPNIGPAAYEFRQEKVATNVRIFSEALAQGNVALIDEPLQIHLRQLGLKLKCTDEDYHRLAYGFLQAILQNELLLQRRDAGEIVETEMYAPAAKTAVPALRGTSAVSCASLFDDWNRAAIRRPKTSDDYKRVVAEFSSVVSDISPLRLTKRDFIQYRDTLQSRGQHWKTVEKKLGILKTVFRLAVDNDRIASSPCERIRVERPRVEKKAVLPFTVPELKRLFASPVFVRGVRPKGGGGEAAYWMPLLGAFTGAREEELAQLQVADIRNDAMDAWYVSVSDEAEGGTVKTAASRRQIPLHAEVVACGFLVYVEQLRKRRQEWLFPDLKPGAYGKRAANWSKWFGRYLRQQVGIKDSRRVFHSLRHAFKDACRACGIEEAVHDALTGHAGSGEGRGYGSGTYPAAPLYAAMRALHYPSLDLSHLYPKQQSVGKRRPARPRN